ncbi:OmpH family outer membrane protein [Hwanghaeella sp.]|uniref:OmpH family outer membrane protein n=1 Tax=Hwanghaeella sp. TaxID=2605943 RepID=UPI003CCB7DFC
MSRSIRAYLFAVGIAFVYAFSANAQAQQMPAPVIAVIDVSAVERQSVAWQSLRDQIEARRAAFQSQLETEQRGLEEERNALVSQQNVLAPEVFQQRQQEFRQKLAELQGVANQRKQELDRLYASARRQIREALREVVVEIAQERGINLMLNMSREDRTVSYVDGELLVSEEALKRLNQRIQTVTLE